MINEYIHKLRLPAVLCVSADGLSICGAIVSVDTNCQSLNTEAVDPEGPDSKGSSFWARGRVQSPNVILCLGPQRAANSSM